MTDRIKAEKERQYTQDFLLVASLVYHWRKMKPENDELKAMSLSIADIGDYVKGLENENKILRKIIEDGETK